MRANIDKQRKSMPASWKKQENGVDQMSLLMTDIVGSIDGISTPFSSRRRVGDEVRGE